MKPAKLLYALPGRLDHVEEIVASGKQLKRVANRGHTQSCNLKDDTSVDLFQDDQLLATWQIIPQYWQVNHWQDYTKTKDLLDIVDGHLIGSGEQGGFSWNIDIAWTANNSKWAINVVAPGILFRFEWQIVFTTLGQEFMESGVLKLGYEDYPGETSDDEGVTERNIIFEPDGINDELIVDPYINIVEDATYITADFTSSEQAVWTIATENAVLIENSSIRAIIAEDYYWWCCYAEKLIRFRHDTGATTTGMALDGGNTYCITGNLTQVGSTEMYFYPCDDDTNTNKSTIATNWLSVNYPTITGNGSIVIDMIFPENIDADAGFNSDGAYTIDLDPDDHNAKLTFHQTERSQAFVLPNSSVRTGDGTTEHLLGHWKCNDNTTSSTVVAEVGTNGNWEVASSQANRNTDNDSTTDSVRGRALDTQSLYFLDMICGSGTIHDNAFYQKGSIVIKLKPQFAHDVGSHQTVFELNVGGAGDLIIFMYSYSANTWLFLTDFAGNKAINYDTTYTDNDNLQRWHTLICQWDTENDFQTLIVNSHPERLYVPDTPSSSEPSKFFIGCNDSYGSTGDFIIDEISTYDAPILSFGTFVCAQHIDEDDFTDAHSDITFLWHGSDTAKIGSDITKVGAYDVTGPDGISNTAFNPTASTGYATAVTSGNISASEGSLIFWVRDLSTLAADSTFFFADTDFEIWWDDSDNDIVFQFSSTGLVRTTVSIIDANWHHIRVWWKANIECGIAVDGIVETSDTSVGTVTLDTNMYFNAQNTTPTQLADVATYGWTITDSMGTPQQKFVLGSGPVVIPRITRG